MDRRTAEIVRLRRSGFTLEDIGERLGITRERVRQLQKAAGVVVEKVSAKPWARIRNKFTERVARRAIAGGVSRGDLRVALGDWTDEIKIEPGRTDGLMPADKILLTAYWLGRGLSKRAAVRAAGSQFQFDPTPTKVVKRLRELGVDLNPPDGRKKGKSDGA